MKAFTTTIATAGALALIAISGTAGPATAQTPRPPLPLPVTARVGLGERLELTLRDAVERALRENIDIRVQRYEVDATDLRLWGARGAYDPRVGFSTGSTSSSTPATSVLQGSEISAETSSSRSFGPTVSQYLPTGGSVSASFSNSRASTNNAFSFVDPLFSSSLTLEFQQPLLRGLFANQTRYQVQTLGAATRISEADFRRTVSTVVRRVHEQYWSLVYAQEAYNARQESRNLAVNQRAIIAQQVQAGLVTPVGLTSADAEVAIRDQELIQAEVQIVAAQNGLKRLLANDPGDVIWAERIVPVDSPQVEDAPSSLDDVMREALDRRPELDRLNEQVRQQEITRSFAAWETRPQVNLGGTLTSIGRAGKVFTPIYDAAGGITPIGKIPDPSHSGFGGWEEAWNQVLAYNFPSWTLRLDVQVPLFNRAARAQLAQADVARRQLDAQIKGQQQSIMVEVANAYETVQLQRRSLDVARLARELSQEQLRGETARFEVGFTTNFEVLRYQRDLGEARVRELRSMIDYQIAVAALQDAMGVIVSDDDLMLAK